MNVLCSAEVLSFMQYSKVKRGQSIGIDLERSLCVSVNE